MQAIRYEAPGSVNDAVRLMQADPEARVLAGGTDLLIQCRSGVRRPTAFIDIKRIPELVDITVDAQGLRLGAAAPAADVSADENLRQRWPGLAEAAALIGSMQIQGRGSVGGNLCNASPAADTPCPLIVNRAVCVIAGPQGRRTVEAAPARACSAAASFLPVCCCPFRHPPPPTRTCASRLARKWTLRSSALR